MSTGTMRLEAIATVGWRPSLLGSFIVFFLKKSSLKFKSLKYFKKKLVPLAKVLKYLKCRD